MNNSDKKPQKRLNKNTVISIIIQTIIVIGITIVSVKYPTAFGTIGTIVYAVMFMYFVYFWLTFVQHYYRRQEWTYVGMFIILGIVVLIGTYFLFSSWF